MYPTSNILNEDRYISVDWTQFDVITGALQLFDGG